MTKSSTDLEVIDLSDETEFRYELITTLQNIQLALERIADNTQKEQENYCYD